VTGYGIIGVEPAGSTTGVSHWHTWTTTTLQEALNYTYKTYAEIFVQMRSKNIPLPVSTGKECLPDLEFNQWKCHA